MTTSVSARTCPHCSAAIALDLARKCAKCRKELPPYCFACYAPLASEDERACASCGRRRWLFGDHTELPCAVEGGSTVRRHRWMTTLIKGGKVRHEWRCMKCLTDETRTDAFAHFPEPASVTT